MDRRTFANRVSQGIVLGSLLASAGLGVPAAWAAGTSALLRGTGDLGLVIERAAGRVQIVDTSSRSKIGAVDGLGDLSHASAVFSRDGRFAYVFGRDGGLSKIDLLEARLVRPRPARPAGDDLAARWPTRDRRCSPEPDSRSPHLPGFKHRDDVRMCQLSGGAALFQKPLS